MQYRPKIQSVDIIEQYFESKYGKLFIMIVKYLKQLDANSIDLIFADPPYNINKAEWDTFSSQKEYVDWSMEWITEAHRVLKKLVPIRLGFSEILADVKWQLLISL
jgi:site-specific DNA-methyltransferase (adenine-specific)